MADEMIDGLQASRFVCSIFIDSGKAEVALSTACVFIATAQSAVLTEAFQAQAYSAVKKRMSRDVYSLSISYK